MEEIIAASAGAAEARGEPQAGPSMEEERAVERLADGAGVVGLPIRDRALDAVELSDSPLVPGDEALEPWEQGLQSRTPEEALAITPDRVRETHAAGAAADTQRQWPLHHAEPDPRAPAETQHQGERETARAVEEVRAIADEIARRRAQAGHGGPEQ
jgi:hypothetical protein